MNMNRRALFYDDDDDKLHPPHTCTTYNNVRVNTTVISWISVLVGGIVLGLNLTRDDRRRYPGRLVPLFGFSIFLFNLTVALGLVVDFKQVQPTRSGPPAYQPHLTNHLTARPPRPARLG